MVLGPARVLATETKLEHGSGRPGHIIWITAAGRLKRVAPEQLRAASEREKLIAEFESPTPFSWTIHGLLQGVDRGQYDVYDDRSFDSKHEKGMKRSRSVGVFPSDTPRVARRQSSVQGGAPS